MSNNNHPDGFDGFPMSDLASFFFGQPLFRAFDEAAHGFGGAPGGVHRAMSRTRTSGGYHSPVDIEDRGTHYRLTADLPGVPQSDVSLTVNDNEVCLSARRQLYEGADRSGPAAGPFFSRERRSGSFERCFGLPTKIREDKTTATLKDGVLEVDLMKGEQSQHTIKIL